jgi:very-short-patch-repair endonuclease
MREWGFAILRFLNDEVTNELDSLVSKINDYLLQAAH